MNKVFAVFLVSIGFVSCNPSTPSETREIYVAQNQVDCKEPVSGKDQKCFLTKATLNDKWGVTYNSISGFEYQAGFQYHLKIQVTRNTSGMTDALPENWTLLDVLDRQAKADEAKAGQ